MYLKGIVRDRERGERDGEKERGICHPLLHSAYGHNTTTKPGSHKPGVSNSPTWAVYHCSRRHMSRETASTYEGGDFKR